MTSKQKEIFNKLADERLEEITNLDKKVNPKDLKNKYKGPTADAKFNEFDNAINLLDKIREDEIRLADTKNGQEEFNSNLSEIKKVNKKFRVKEQKNTLHDIKMLYEARNGAIKFYDGYSSMASEAKHEATKGIGLKILNLKQILQRLPIIFVQVKAGNTPENLINEIQQILYNKKVYHNIIKSL